MKRIFSYAKYLVKCAPLPFMEGLNNREVLKDDSFDYVEVTLEDGFVGRVYLDSDWVDLEAETVRDYLQLMSKTDVRACVMLRNHGSLSDQEINWVCATLLLDTVKVYH